MTTKNKEKKIIREDILYKLTLHIHQYNEENQVILHYMFLLSMVYYLLDQYILVNDVLILHMHDLHHIILLISLMDPI